MTENRRFALLTLVVLTIMVWLATCAVLPRATG